MINDSSKDTPLALLVPDKTIKIRLVMEDDCDALHSELWAHRTLTRTRELVRRIVDAHSRRRGAGIVVMDGEDESHLLAYGQVQKWTKCAEISDLIVLEDHRNQGIGTAMIQFLCRHAQDEDDIDCVEIGAAHTNTRALALYRRLGFKDAYTLNLNLCLEGKQPVIYLRIMFADYEAQS